MVELFKEYYEYFVYGMFILLAIIVIVPGFWGVDFSAKVKNTDQD